MRLVLDSNEYIFAFGLSPTVPSQKLIRFLMETDLHKVRVQRTIVGEVCRKVPEPDQRAFFRALDEMLEEDCDIDEDFVVPHHVAQRYQDLGFKEADAHIAAYAHVIGADMVLSENRRHFHDLARHLPFRVSDAEQFLKRHASAR